MNIADLPDDSDTSDEDYVPTVKSEDVPSEVDSDGDPEEPLSDTEQLDKRGTKRKRRVKSSRKKAKQPENSDGSKETNQNNELNEEERKKKADSLWADFMKDTGFKSKSSNNGDIPSPNDTSNVKKLETISHNSKLVPKTQEKKVKITQIFKFAGEEVEVEKEIPADSTEARLSNKASSSVTSQGRRRGNSNLKGIGSVLSQLGKKPKISTLEKSKLDWDKYKKEENIEEELQAFNKGKDGYLEKQDFLQRADLRTFEIEKDIRTIERNKRMNMNTPM